MQDQGNTQLFLNPDEMAVRKIYWPLFEQESITKVFRPGNRPCGAWRGYCAQQNVTAKALDKIGADWAKIAPTFVENKTKELIIAKTEVKKISELAPEDFIGSSPDVVDVSSLQYHLGVLYNLYPEDLGLDGYVTIVSFNYK